MKSFGMMDGSTGTRSVRLRLSVALVLLSTCACTDCADHNVTAEAGETAVLPCECPTNQTPYLVWQKSVSKQLLLVNYYTGEDDKDKQNIAEEFQNRTALRLTGNCSLKLHSVRRSDEGLYKCYYLRVPLRNDNIYLEVTESSALTVDIPQNVYKISRGDNVTIPCRFTPPKAGDVVKVTWKAFPDVPGDPAICIIIYYSPTAIKVLSKYKGRATLIHDIPGGKADLQLQRVTSADTRVYECTVEVLNNDEDAVSDTASLIVLVAPSPPICKTEQYYEDIKLTCRSEQGTPTPTYKWRSFDSNNIPRPIPSDATDENGVLSLYNIYKETPSFFICTSTNEIGSEKCNLTLAVMPLNVCLKR